MAMRLQIGVLTVALALAASTANAQDFREQYEQFKQQAQQTYSDFRAEANTKYCEYLKLAWESYKQMPVQKKPKEKPVPPVVLPENDKTPVVDIRPILLDSVLTPSPIRIVQPKPIAPIKDVPTVAPYSHHFSFYGTLMSARLPQQRDTKLTLLNSSCSKENVAEAWASLSTHAYDNTLRDCLALRSSYRLGDYAYLLMLRSLSENYFGRASNASVMLTAWLFCQSGYKMRLGKANDRLVLLYASNQVIYDVPYYYVDGIECYVLVKKGEKFSGQITACNVSFPGEQPLSLEMSESMALTDEESEIRTVKSRRYPNISIDVSVNKNLIAFENDYLSSYKDGNFMTRWAMLANTPLQESTAQEIAEQMKPLLSGKTQLEQVEMLLNWVQTGFVYEYDDKVWGEDRAFFAEETLYYPYCDCEDRAILFSRLVRNLVGLKCALVYYPGHLAAAVHFNKEVKGDYLLVNGEKFTIADPTYINAPVGLSMPKMVDKSATAILLQ